MKTPGRFDWFKNKINDKDNWQSTDLFDPNDLETAITTLYITLRDAGDDTLPAELLAFSRTSGSTRCKRILKKLSVRRVLKSFVARIRLGSRLQASITLVRASLFLYQHLADRIETTLTAFVNNGRSVFLDPHISALTKRELLKSFHLEFTTLEGMTTDLLKAYRGIQPKMLFAPEGPQAQLLCSMARMCAFWRLIRPLLRNIDGTIFVSSLSIIDRVEFSQRLTQCIDTDVAMVLRYVRQLQSVMAVTPHFLPQPEVPASTSEISDVDREKPSTKAISEVEVKAFAYEVSQHVSVRNAMRSTPPAVVDRDAPHARTRLVLQVLQEAIDTSTTTNPDNNDILRLLLRGATTFRSLPDSYYLSTSSLHCDAHWVLWKTGGFGDIYRGKWLDQDVALKAFRMFRRSVGAGEGSNHTTREVLLLREIVLWRQLSHPSVHPFLGVSEGVLYPRLAIVSRWENRGSVNDAVCAGYWKELTVLRPRWIRQIAEGLAYLHSRGVVHGDLRGDNVLITDDLNACLTDFGLTVLVDASTLTNGSMGGLIPFAWAAPELFEETCTRPTTLCDVFSFGRTCVEIYAAQPPFGTLTEMQVYRKIVSGAHPVRPTDGAGPNGKGQAMPDALWELVVACWEADAEGRPGMEDVALSEATKSGEKLGTHIYLPHAMKQPHLPTLQNWHTDFHDFNDLEDAITTLYLILRDADPDHHTNEFGVSLPPPNPALTVSPRKTRDRGWRAFWRWWSVRRVFRSLVASIRRGARARASIVLVRASFFLYQHLADKVETILTALVTEGRSVLLDPGVAIPAKQAFTKPYQAEIRTLLKNVSGTIQYLVSDVETLDPVAFSHRFSRCIDTDVNMPLRYIQQLQSVMVVTPHFLPQPDAPAEGNDDDVKAFAYEASQHSFVRHVMRWRSALPDAAECKDARTLRSRRLTSTQAIDITHDIASRNEILRLLLRGVKQLKSLPSSYYLPSHSLECDPSVALWKTGGFGDVYRGKWKSDGDVALKVLRTFLRTDANNLSNEALLLREIVLWRQLSHPSVHPFLGVSEGVLLPRLAIVSRWEKRGSVNDAAETLYCDQLQYLRPRWIKQIAEGLAYLHDRGVVHGDLRGDNVLITDDLNACLTDFGLTVLVDASTLTNGAAGGLIPFAWAAPELFEEACTRPTPLCDVFSFGRTCVEVYSGQPPFGYLTEMQIYNKVMKGEHPPRPAESEGAKGQGMLDVLWDLVVWCWEVNAADRPGMGDLVSGIAGILQVND
ncbi:hypothetical protein EUX98_g5871 [Antrodiella citrinella]|uniref:Protein kinase domain-containing protein n=1 Tax=Antrodiella citrinella TaxID=2447956 RepID=A0A4S4MS91_9APHY|nr:hypothetical protein EUX98_g5871 [Antrodiella citrinella]